MEPRALQLMDQNLGRADLSTLSPLMLIVIVTNAQNRKRFCISIVHFCLHFFFITKLQLKICLLTLFCWHLFFIRAFIGDFD